MIESIDLIDLYANKHKKNIEKETKEEVEEILTRYGIIDKKGKLVIK